MSVSGGAAALAPAVMSTKWGTASTSAPQWHALAAFLGHATGKLALGPAERSCVVSTHGETVHHLWKHRLARFRRHRHIWARRMW
jgi:hypothetical protein